MIGINTYAIQNAIRRSESAVQTSMLRLSTGKRINSAKDDPAGLAIATRMESDIVGMRQAVRNAQDGISRAQTAEGMINEVTNMAQRIRELALQSASGTYTDNDRKMMDAEVQELKAQIFDTLGQGQFNGVPLFDTAAAGSGPGTPGTPGYGTVTLLQIGAQAGDTVSATTGNLDLTTLAALSVATKAGANAALGTVDDFVKNTNTVRAGLGATQSRLESTINLLNTNIVNLSDAQSRIMDVDYAAESVSLAKAQITLQAGMAMLVQANQMRKAMIKALLDV
ncbi:flagellin [Novosphingobium sp. JCM 18896]|uniref:flagellin n=1 Tax=Novosphingobium sp. JCM 18896 TaxID=2989731 RepID=UPI002223C2DA|nr:flagellin [Novosphingobium sp. JCM 18896]MCW1427707.1 flagellin [Novosphingobium sp. JCM 18896]